MNRPTVTERESTHIDTAFMGPTSFDGVTIGSQATSLRIAPSIVN